MSAIRILHVLNGLGTGGTEAIIMSLYRHIDRTKVQFDFLVRSNESFYTDEIEKLGGRVYVMPEYPKKYWSNKRETKKFFRQHAHEYSAIHVHGNAILYVNVFHIAKKHGIKERIFHSHNTSTRLIYLPLHMINKLRIKRLATDFFACSDAAGKWSFGSTPFTVIKNGISTENFRYNKALREDVRSKLNLQDEMVYGHVGRFVEAKNHVFLIETFEKIVEKNENSVLLLIGEGRLKVAIEELSRDKGIRDKVIFLGATNNVAEYMQAMDMFLFPSLHEGLGIVAIEAQASGLPCLLSDTIPKEVAISDLVKFLPITDSSAWSEHSLEYNFEERRDTAEIIVRAGYDIRTSAKILEEYYLSKA